MAKKFSEDYASKNPKLLFKKNVAILNFENLTPEVKKYDVGAAAASSLVTRLSQSTIFNLVERTKIKDVMKEIEMGMSGAVDPAKASRAGELAGAELLVMGTVGEQGSGIVVSGRLVDASTGNVISTMELSVPRDEVLTESKEMYFSAFQSEYGISLSVVPGIIYLTNLDSDDVCNIFGIDISYRLYKYLNIGLGYSVLFIGQYTSESADMGGGVNSTINYSFQATGPSIFAEGTYPFFRWFTLGLRVDYLMLATSKHMQDAADVPIYFMNDSGIWTDSTIRERVLVESWQSDGIPFIMRVAVKWQFLISKRLSISLLTGYVVATDYVPDVFEANGKRHWGDDADENGTFREYGTHSFARYADGSRVKINLSGIALSLAVGLHF